MAAVEELWDRVVAPSWRAFRDGSFKDKKVWATGFIHGTSGVGKTRFNLELLGLLAKYSESRSPARPAGGDCDANALQAALSNSKTVVLDIRHNGDALTEDEAKWPPGVILGLRLAGQYWLPLVPYPSLRDAFRSRAAEDPTLWETFELRRVLDAVQRYKAAPTFGDPSPRIPEILHVAIDEIQTAFDIMVPYRGALGQVREEPLSTALNRALQGAISQPRELFVVGTLTGTAARNAAEVLDPTDAKTVSVLLSPLSSEPIRQLVATFRFPAGEGQRATAVSGREWLDKGGKPFQRLLATLGGNVRALECLERVLMKEGSPSESLDLDRISDNLIREVAETFNIASWGQNGSALFALLLALAGIPVTRKTIVSKPGTPRSQRVTVADLERAGLVHLRPPPPTHGRAEHWATTWNLTQTDLVMEVPFALARAALLATGDCHEHPRDCELFAGASRILTSFYPNAASFEKLALEHRVLRHNVASEWARRRRRNYVEARDLFCGTICDQSLTELRFARATKVRRLSAPAAGVWWRAAAKEKGAEAKLPTSITLQDGSTVELLQHRAPYAILLSRSNAVDGLLNEQLSHPVAKVVALVYIDTKHSQIGAPTDNSLSHSDDIKTLVKKRRYLADQFPNAEHIMVIMTDKRAQRPDGQPHTAATLLRIGSPSSGSPATATDPRTCLITMTEDSLGWAMSPTFAHFLTTH